MAPQAQCPRNRSELLVCLTKTGPFPAQLTRLAEFSLGQPDVIAFGSATDIAASAGVSPSTVSRLAIALGFSSFRGLRDMFRDELRCMSERRHRMAKRIAPDARTVAGL